MARHVVSISDAWDHKESEDCGCSLKVVTDSEGELIYVHEDRTRMASRRHEKPAQQNNENKVKELKKQQEELIKTHDTLLKRALDNPKEYAGGIVQELNNGILIRLEHLMRTLSIIEHGSY